MDIPKVAKPLVSRHPLQRLESPSRGASALLHSLSLASFAYSYRHLVVTPNPVNESYGWHFQYLTILGLTMATATCSIGLLADATASRRLFLIKNFLSMTSAPLEMVVTIMYWGLRSIDRSLVLADWAPRITVAEDLSFHLVPAVSLAVDLLFFSPPWTITFAPSLALSGLIAFAYWFWVERCYAKNGFYPYPIFEVDVSMRVALFAASAFVMAASTSALAWTYGLMNGKERAGHVRGD